MANHAKTGSELERYLARRRRPHKVSGLYLADGKGKTIRLTLDAWGRKKRHRGNGKGDSVVHYEPYVCEGR